jgi:hypothetical protein
MNAAGHTFRATAALAAAAALLMAGCATPPPPASATQPSPADACKALVESITAAVPAGQSLAELEARGVRVQTPLTFPPGTVPRPLQSSGAAVQMAIQPDGTVLPGSPKTLKTVGEPQIAAAMEAGALSMKFDIDGAAKPAAPIPYTATFAVCIHS